MNFGEISGGPEQSAWKGKAIAMIARTGVKTPVAEFREIFAVE
jgi:hypothetical protein